MPVCRTYRSFLVVFVLFLTNLLQVSCNNEVDLNSDWKETIVIYGILEPGSEQQKIRVSKAFQKRNSSAIRAAQVSDSIFLDTVIVHLVDLSTGKRYRLKPSFDEPKEPGIFANDRNPIYILDISIHNYVVKESTKYVIEALNPITGLKVSAETETIGRSTVVAPVSKDQDVFYFGTNPSFVIAPGRGVFTYDAKFDLYIKEWDKNIGDTTYRTLRWNFASNLFTDRNPTVVFAKMPRKTFFQFLSFALEEKKDLRRKVLKADFKVIGANKEFYDFISINRPSIGIVQKQTQYSNITNGYGLFASRTVQWIRDCDVHTGLTAALRTDDETKGLNFEY